MTGRAHPRMVDPIRQGSRIPPQSPLSKGEVSYRKGFEVLKALAYPELALIGDHACLPIGLAASLRETSVMAGGLDDRAYG